jgi:hypothetical protein
MIRTRDLPSDAVIDLAPGVIFGSAACADEVDEGLACGELLQERREPAVGAGDHHHFSVLEKLFGPIDHQPPDMGKVIEDVLAIGSHQERQSYVAVIRAQLVALADESSPAQSELMLRGTHCLSKARNIFLTYPRAARELQIGR